MVDHGRFPAFRLQSLYSIASSHFERSFEKLGGTADLDNRSEMMRLIKCPAETLSRFSARKLVSCTGQTR